MQKIVLLLSISCGAVYGLSIDNLAQRATNTEGNSVHTSDSSCWYQAEAKYGVPAKLLYAIARVETKFNPNAVGKNKNGSEDIGIMQINSGWLPILNKQGITRQDLFNACTNIQVGAWILSNNIKKLGYNWNAIGAYNAVSLDKRDKYAKKVHNAILELGLND